MKETRGHKLRSSGATRGVGATNLAPLTFPEWVPDAVTEVGKQLQAELAKEKDPAIALEVLSRLVASPCMRRVWQELYRKNRHQGTKEFLHRACLTHASGAAANRQQAGELRKKGGAINERDAKLLEAEAALLETEAEEPADPRWTEQDRAAQLFLWHAYRTALDCEPVYLSDIHAKMEELQGSADLLRKLAATLKRYGMRREAKKLKDIAEDCKDEAWIIDPSDHHAGAHQGGERSLFSPAPDDPWILTRQTDHDHLRTYVIILSLTTESIFRKPLYGTLTNVTNAVFRPQELITVERVREILRVANSRLGRAGGPFRTSSS
jgi:hypothetical protein